MKAASWREFQHHTYQQRKSMVDNDIREQRINAQNTNWIKIRQSFTHSMKWKNFRKEFLSKHPLCAKCNKAANTVHHFTPLQDTALNNGFLTDLDYEERFQALCQDCHVLEHEDLIKAIQSNTLAKRKRKST